jgi:hypothetical protein
MTLVEVTVENKRRTREVARTFDQLTCEAVLSAIENAEGLTSNIREFGEKAALSPAELQQIDQIWQDAGCERAELLPRPAFASAPPLACLPSGKGYTGDFPYDAVLLTEDKMRSICTMETSRELYQRIAALPYASRGSL